MRQTFHFVPALSMLAMGVVLAGCAVKGPSTYDHEDFDESSTYSRVYQAPSPIACESARRALLSQGYVINKATADVVDGRKSFQQTAENHVEIEFHIVCAPDGIAGKSATVFVNAVQDRYTLKKTASSASVGVSVLGSVSMPFGSSDDSMVKVGSETIASSKFYNGFFGLLEQYLAPMQGQVAPPPPAPADLPGPVEPKKADTPADGKPAD